jgi:hypothetical protein
MLRSSLAALLVGGTLLTSVAIATPVSAQATVSPADYAPATSLIYVEAELDLESDQITRAEELIERSNVMDLIPESEREEFDEGTAGLSLFAEGDAGFFVTEIPEDSLESLDDLTSEATDVTADPEAAMSGDIPGGWAAVIHPDDAEASFEFYSEIILGDDEAAVEEVEHEGYTISYTEPADEYSEGVAVALVDDVIAVATTPDDIEPVIDTATGAVDSLADSEAYEEVRGALNEEFLIGGFINGPAITESLDEAGADLTASLPEDVTASLEATQGFVVWADDPGFRIDTVAFPAEGIELPEAPVFDASFADQLPASSLVYTGGADLGKNPGLNALALALAQGAIGEDPVTSLATPVADPEAHAEEVFAEAEDVIGFNLKTDVLDQLVGEWGFAATLEDLDTTTLEPDVHAVFVSDVEDSETVTDVTETITNMIASQTEEGVDITSRQIDGADVTVVNASSADGLPLVMEFGVVDDQLLIGVNEGIDEYIEGPDAPLSEDETFAETFEALPEDVTSISYLNVETALPFIEQVIEASSSTSADADPSCGEYSSQEDAQAAYDEDSYENYQLDLDFDGEACEDFFAAATPAADAVDLEDLGILSVGAVTTNDGDSIGSNTLILIAD